MGELYLKVFTEETKHKPLNMKPNTCAHIQCNISFSFVDFFIFGKPSRPRNPLVGRTGFGFSEDFSSEFVVNMSSVYVE